MKQAIAHTSSAPARSPQAALDALRARLADPMWDGWRVDEPVEVNDHGFTEYIAHATLSRELDRAVKQCPHFRDPEQCTECTPF